MAATTPKTAANTVAVAIPFLAAIVTAVSGMTHVPADTQSKIATALDGVQQGAAALAASETAVESKPILDRIEADAQAVLAIAATLPLPGPAGVAFRIASIVVPMAIAGVKMLIATKTTIPAA